MQQVVSYSSVTLSHFQKNVSQYLLHSLEDEVDPDLMEEEDLPIGAEAGDEEGEEEREAQEEAEEEEVNIFYL